MDNWSNTSQDTSALMVDSMTNNPDDWEDWLRWDPANESHSPENSSKDSTDSPIQDSSTLETYPWMGRAGTNPPPLIIGEDSSFTDLSSGLGPSELDFSSGQAIDPFIFGSDASLQPVVESLRLDIPQANKDIANSPWPSSETVSQAGQTNVFLSAPSPRRKSRSSSGAAATESLISPASQVITQPPTVPSLSPQPTQPTKKKPGRKRKVDTAAQGNTGAGGGEPPVKKTSHNVIEKRYRNNLNDKILELRDSVPSLRAMSKPSGSEDDSEELDGLTPAHKLNKSTIMAKATEYIRHLEKRNKTMADEMAALKSRMAALEQTYARNSALSNAPGSPMVGRSRQSSFQTANFTPPVLGSPEQIRLRSNAQNQASTSFDGPIDEEQKKSKHVRGNGGTGFMSKLMVGSMAGLMVMEGYSEHSQDDGSGKGLFAAPLHLAKRGLFAVERGSSPVSATQAALPVFKFTVLLSAVAYLILPLLRSKPKKKVQTIPYITLTAAPSLAASVEVKRKAWLTAIQSVWTPRHFLIEVVLVTVRMIELSLRRIIGFDKYAELLGMTKDDEAARVKAWDIAIDAQLAGGDVEVSYHRLLLTLMASGTLPDSPIRLMQKAVHFRIFFWELANAGYGNLFMFKDFTAHVARVYWDSARTQQRRIVSGSLSKVDELNHTIELLPDHLAKLVELECDEVLTDDIVQRAYNLAWNRPSAENTAAQATLDEVVHDPAIRSPLDAVAAWFANTVMDEGLALSLHDQPGDGAAKDVEYMTRLAADAAPPASSTLTRALVAKAVLLRDGRETNIASSLESLPHAPLASQVLGHSPTTGHLNVVHHVPLSTEVRTALTFAKILSLGDSRSSASSREQAAIALNHVEVGSKSFTLLTAVAGLNIVKHIGTEVEERGKAGMERLANGIRVWVGTKAGRESGLSNKEKGFVVKKCIATTKKLSGWRDDDADSGYGSGPTRRSSGEGIVE